MRRTGATTSGECAMNLGVNQRSMVPETIAGMPPARMAAMRAFQISGLPMCAAVSQSTRRANRCGAFAPSQIPTCPPHGKTAEMRTGDFDGIHESKNIAAELLLRVRAGSDGGEAVTAGVIAEDAKVAPQCGDLRLPHR